MQIHHEKLAKRKTSSFYKVHVCSGNEEWKKRIADIQYLLRRTRSHPEKKPRKATQTTQLKEVAKEERITSPSSETLEKVTHWVTFGAILQST